MRFVPFRKLFLVLMGLAWLSTGCPGVGEEPLHGMLNLSFPETAVCDSQKLSIPFRNTSDRETVILGARISGGTDPLGNFSLQSMVVGAEEKKAVNGAFQDIRIPPFQDYSINVSYLPKTESADHTAIIDIAFLEPREGVIQVALNGKSGGRSSSCASSSSSGGPVDLDKEVTLTVELLIAATSATEAPINTNQGLQPFVKVGLPLVLNKSAKTVVIPAYIKRDFVLPPPDRKLAGLIGDLIRGSIVVTIPEEVSGEYDEATGSLTIPKVHIKMDSALDFAAELNMTLTTGKLPVGAVSPHVNIDALKNGFGDPSRYNSVSDEIFGGSIDATTGKVFLVGVTKLEGVDFKPGINPTLKGNLRNVTMAILMEGTIKKK